MEKGRFAVFLTGLVVLVGAIVFLKWALIGRDLPREALVERELRILSYSTFVSSSGPAPELVREFKKRCRCKVEFATTGDAGLLLERLKMTQDRAQYDVVIGLDRFWAHKASQDWEWLDPIITQEKNVEFVDGVLNKELPQFIPFDHAPMTFIYRKSDVSVVPKSLKDFLKPEFKSSISLQDPRSSSPGLQFLSWIVTTQGESAGDFLKELKPAIHSISPSWALSYGLFKKGQSRFVFSYLTSLAYHLAVEQDSDYAALDLEEGHPIQVEYAGIPKGCRNCELAQDFLKFLVEPASQVLIAERNFMLPAVKSVGVPESLRGLPSLKILPQSVEMPSLQLWDQTFQ